MLSITIPGVDMFDEGSGKFITTKTQTILLEHSLVSISKWESKWRKPFLSKARKTFEESADYVRCMTITQNVDSRIYNYLTSENMRQINEYIEEPMTATTFSEEKKGRNSEIITAEIIYYWMIALNIPFECQKWHLNKLLTLINVCNIKNSPPKKMGRKELIDRNRALNAARRKSLSTKG